MSNSRTNNATSANVDRTCPVYASGTFKNVWQGTYTVGERKGQKCVAKEFKTGSTIERQYFDEELGITNLTLKIVDDFHAAKIITQKILLNTPEIWEYLDTKNLCLVEPLIENFEKFNSNTGWNSLSGGAWSEAMQALSHFSYHSTNRQYLLCDLQGGAYSNGYVLSDPVIMSKTPKLRGPADLGAQGITTFFLQHRCNQFCRSDWVKPNLVGMRPSFAVQEGTTMLSGGLSTRQDRNPLTRLRE